MAVGDTTRVQRQQTGNNQLQNVLDRAQSFFGTPVPQTTQDQTAFLLGSLAQAVSPQGSTAGNIGGFVAQQVQNEAFTAEANRQRQNLLNLLSGQPAVAPTPGLQILSPQLQLQAQQAASQSILPFLQLQQQQQRFETQAQQRERALQIDETQLQAQLERQGVQLEQQQFQNALATIRLLNAIQQSQQPDVFRSQVVDPTTGATTVQTFQQAPSGDIQPVGTGAQIKPPKQEEPATIKGFQRTEAKGNLSAILKPILRDVAGEFLEGGQTRGDATAIINAVNQLDDPGLRLESIISNFKTLDPTVNETDLILLINQKTNELSETSATITSAADRTAKQRQILEDFKNQARKILKRTVENKLAPAGTEGAAGDVE